MNRANPGLHGDGSASHGPRSEPDTLASSRLDGLTPYRPSAPDQPGACRLHANEGLAPHLDLSAALSGLDLSRYPSAGPLEAKIAAAHGVEPERVVVTAGADDALSRLAGFALERGRAAALFEPTFEMIPRYVQLSGAEARPVPWLDAPFPEKEFLAALEEASVGFVVSPSAPGGEIAPVDAILRLADRARLLVADLAYVEFAPEDPTDALVRHPRVVVLRTFSKAMGLAGLRVGYAIAPPAVADGLRTVGQPYAVSSVALHLAEAAFEQREALVAAARSRVETERHELFLALERVGARPVRSAANFVLARFGSRGPAVAASLAENGYRVRLFSGGLVDGALRITCPQDEKVFAGLLAALQEGAR